MTIPTTNRPSMYEPPRPKRSIQWGSVWHRWWRVVFSGCALVVARISAGSWRPAHFWILLFVCWAWVAISAFRGAVPNTARKPPK